MVVAPERADQLALDHAVSEQHVRLAQMLGQAKGKVSERVMYYRRPQRGAQGGWIVTSGTNPERQLGLFRKGFVPLDRYGFVNPQGVTPPDPEADSAEAYRVWAKILLTPGGPEEFPVSQLLEQRWYDPAICPVPGVRFPQLAGVALTKFYCPECETVYFHKAIHLARHLRSSHEWDRAEIGAYGQEAGISFTKEATTGRSTVESVTFDVPDEPEPEPEPLPVMEVEEFRAPVRRGRPSKEAY